MNTIARGLVLALAIVVWSAACSEVKPKPDAVAYPDKAKGQTEAQLSQDRAECETFAEKESGFEPRGDTAKGAAKGAVIGGAIGAAAGAAIGAAAGAPGTGAAVGAAAGGTAGGAVGGTKAHKEGQKAYDRAYAACMKERGYVVQE